MYNYEDAFLEGYMDAINEMKDGDFDNPTKLRFFGTIGGGNFKKDMKSVFGIGNDDDSRIKVMEYAMQKGEVFKEPFLAGNGKYGHKSGKLYRKNGIFPGGQVASTIQYPEYTTFTDGTGMTHTIKTGSHTIPDDQRYLDMYRHLRPDDRERLIKQYSAKNKKKKKRK